MVENNDENSIELPKSECHQFWCIRSKELIKKHPCFFIWSTFIVIVLVSILFAHILSLLSAGYKRGIDLHDFSIPYRQGLSLGASIDSSSLDRMTASPFADISKISSIYRGKDT